MTRWRFIVHEGHQLYDIGIDADGVLHNPNSYPPDIARAAVEAANERRRVRRSAAATKAARTRQERQARRVYQAAAKIIDGAGCGPASACYICGRGLGDPESEARGIGSDCWQDVLAAITEANPKQTASKP